MASKFIMNQYMSKRFYDGFVAGSISITGTTGVP